MAEEPLVDIVMSTYNRARLLPRAIESVLRQGYRNWRLTIVDDCSADDTWEILKRYGGYRIRVVRNGVNKGSVASKMPYMLNSPAKYLAILDDDDWWEKDYLRKLVEAMESNHWCELCYCDAWRVDEKGDVRYWDSSKGRPFPNILPSCTLLRAETFHRLGGWDESFKYYHAEADYYIRVGGVKKFLHIPEPLVYITISGDALSKNRIANVQALEFLVAKHKGRLSRGELGLYYTRMGLHSAEAGRRSSGYFWRAVRYNPLILEAWGGLVLDSISNKLFLWLYRVYRRLLGYDTKVYRRLSYKSKGR